MLCINRIKVTQNYLPSKNFKPVNHPNLDLDGHCEDIDECDARTHVCTPTQDCNNQIPFYKCSCHVGYIDNQNGDCVDLDECTDGYHDCHSNADCLNSDGSYTCRCHPGYSKGLDAEYSSIYTGKNLRGTMKC